MILIYGFEPVLSIQNRTVPKIHLHYLEPGYHFVKCIDMYLH